MSYSFSVRGADKAAARAALAAKFDEQVVAHQPIHAKDREQALAAADAFLALLVDNPDADVSISMNGSLGWRAEDELTSAGFGVYVGYVQREST